LDQVGQIGSGKTWGATGENLEVDVGAQWLTLGVDPQDGFATFDIGGIDHDLTVESARSQQSRIKDVGTVGRCHHNHPGVAFEPVEFDQQLVESLLTFVMTATKTGVTMTSDGVELVDENDRRCRPFCLFEKVTDPSGTATD